MSTVTIETKIREFFQKFPAENITDFIFEIIGFIQSSRVYGRNRYQQNQDVSALNLIEDICIKSKTAIDMQHPRRMVDPLAVEIHEALKIKRIDPEVFHIILCVQDAISLQEGAKETRQKMIDFLTSSKFLIKDYCKHAEFLQRVQQN